MSALSLILHDIAEKTGSEVRAGDAISGGDIHSGHQIYLDDTPYFLKHNTYVAAPMFETEKRGLELLSNSNATNDTGIKVPKVHNTGGNPTSDIAWLLMEFLPRNNTNGTFFSRFGRALAKMHKIKSNTFGLDHANFIGSLPQNNTPTDSWETFFIRHRIEPQIRMAVNRGRLDKNVMEAANLLYKKLENIFPPENPALLHGDLWSGNFMSSGVEQTPTLFDPAVYFGHREVDLAFSKMFGGFAPEFYAAYNEKYPLEAGFDKRVPYYNLYPLLVHVNLFGGSYITQFTHFLRTI